LIKRYAEKENIDFLLSKGESNYNNKNLYSLKYLHNDEPIPDCIHFESQYLQLSTTKFYIHCKNNNNSNNCCLLRNGCYIIILNIVKKNKKIFVIGKKLKYIDNI